VRHDLVVRIVSLLPSATEIVYALGLEDSLVGVTHECDWPPAAAKKPHVSVSVLPESASPAEVDRLVSSSIANGEPIYKLDEASVRHLQPDLVLTQDLCAVCAVPSGQVNDALEVLGCRAQVVSMDPNSLDDVLGCIARVGDVTDRVRQAGTLLGSLRQRLDTVTHLVAGRPRVRTFALEWSDPPFNGGHWVPGMIETAGGDAVLACPDTPSVRVTWEQIEAEAPDVLVFMPCGYDLEAASREGVPLLGRPELAATRQFFAVDASAYFSRPGPRLVDGVEILASLLHPDVVEPHDPPGARRLR
jgi:iron complex transport system substrate-binding protein